MDRPQAADENSVQDKQRSSRSHGKETLRAKLYACCLDAADDNPVATGRVLLATLWALVILVVLAALVVVMYLAGVRVSLPGADGAIATSVIAIVGASVGVLSRRRTRVDGPQAGNQGPDLRGIALEASRNPPAKEKK